MEIKIGDVIKNRYILKDIILDMYNDFKPAFFLYDKKEMKVINYNKEKMLDLLNIKEDI